MRVPRHAALLTSLALLLVLGSITLYSFLNLRRGMTRLDLIVQEMLLANEASEQTRQLLRRVGDAIVAQDDRSQKAVAETLTSLQGLLQSFGDDAQAPDTKRRLESLRRMIITCREHSQRIFQLSREGRIPEAVTAKDELERVIHFMGEDINALVAGELMYQRGIRDEISHQTARMAVLIVVATGAILVAGFLLLVFAFKDELRRHERLTAELEERVRARSRELEAAQRQLVDSAHLAGRAEVAASVLHNVGNVLNSLNVNATLTAEALGRLPLHKVTRTGQMMAQHRREPAWLRDDPRGQLVPAFLEEFGRTLEEERERITGHVREMLANVEHIKQVIAMQSPHAGRRRLVEPVALTELVGLALRIHQEELDRNAVEVVRRFDALPEVPVEKHKVLQVLVNLISNANKALVEGRERGRRMTLHLGWGQPRHWRLAVEDNGAGIAPENLDKLFRFGFTTRKEGQGIGLHSCALAAQEMNGTLQVRSEGLGHGATFTLEVPLEDVPG